MKNSKTLKKSHRILTGSIAAGGPRRAQVGRANAAAVPEPGRAALPA